MLGLQTRLYGALAVLGILGTIYGVYQYQEYTISSLESKVSTLTEEKNTLEVKLNSSRILVDTYNKNTDSLNKKRDTLEATLPRFQAIAVEKPKLLATKVEQSYYLFHLEKSCYSGNKEACVIFHAELNK